MGYWSNNRWVDTEEVSLHASAQVTATANGDAVELGDRNTIRLELDVTAVGADADETLDVTVETAETDAGPWTEVGAFTQVTQPGGATSERKAFSGLDRFVRGVWTVGGTTPEFTFSLTGEAA